MKWLVMVIATVAWLVSVSGCDDGGSNSNSSDTVAGDNGNNNNNNGGDLCEQACADIEACGDNTTCTINGACTGNALEYAQCVLDKPCDQHGQCLSVDLPNLP